MVYYLVCKNLQWLWLYQGHSLYRDCHLLQRWSEILAAKNLMSIAKWEKLWRVCWQHKTRKYVNSERENSVVWGVKVKVTLVEALRLCAGRTAHCWSRGIALHDKWEHQLDATIKYIFHLKLVSTCFGRDIAHHQEIQLYISAYCNRPCNEEKLT